MKFLLSLFSGALVAALVLTQVGCDGGKGGMLIGVSPMLAAGPGPVGGFGSVRLADLLAMSNDLYAAIQVGSGVTNAVKNVTVEGTLVGENVTGAGFSNTPTITWGAFSNNNQVTVTATAVAGTGSGALVGSNAPVLTGVAALGSNDVTGDFNIHAASGSTLNLFEVYDSAGLAQFQILSNGVTYFKEDAWVWPGSSLNFGQPGVSLTVSISDSGIQAPTVDATFDDVAVDRFMADLSITNFGLTHLDGDVLAPNLSSNASPVNTIGQLADGSLVKIANVAAGTGTNAVLTTNGVVVSTDTDTFEFPDSTFLVSSGSLADGIASISYDLASTTGSGTTVVLSNAPSIYNATLLGDTSVAALSIGDLSVTNVNTNVASSASITIQGDLLFNTYSFSNAVAANVAFTFESVKPGAGGDIHFVSDGSARTFSFLFPGGTLAFFTNTFGMTGTNHTTVASTAGAISWKAWQAGPLETNIQIIARNRTQ